MDSSITTTGGASDHKPDAEPKSKDGHGPHHDDTSKTPKKRRKVVHACVYCRRSHMTCDLERPCTRCIKRNIGHLCRDEPREADSKKGRTGAAGDESESQSDLRSMTADQAVAVALNTMGPPAFEAGVGQAAKSAAFNAGALGQGGAPLQLVQPGQVSGMLPNAMAAAGNVNQFAGFSDAWLTYQNHFHDMHNYHPQYMIAPEVSSEFNLLNDFLHNSLIDDGGNSPENNNSSQPAKNLAPETSSLLSGLVDGSSSSSSRNLLPPSAMSGGGIGGGPSMLPPGTSSAEQGGSIARPSSTAPPSSDKTREYYLQAADPTGNATPEERMGRVLKAKYEAGLLKPFNYVSGYARLHAYLDSHRVAPSSKQRIKRQLDKFRPIFRDKMQALTDIQMVVVEMWFEQTLMEYDRVFASMAIPACCWRRTGEIFRGNKEMAELIHVPVERLRDGKISLHEILTEESVVRYWEEFGTIAFDPAHDALLTSCSLKSPDDESNDPIIKCSLGLKIRRDEHKIPGLIVGNFLPVNPTP